MNDLPGILARIESRLKKLGISARAASLAAGKPDAIRNVQRAIADGKNRAGISTATVNALAVPLKTTPEWLLTGKGDPDGKGATVVGPVPTSFVKVVGVVQAGHWVEIADFEDEAASEEIPNVPGRWSHLPQVAYRIRGASMDLDKFHDGDFAIAVPYFNARQDITEGDRVIVERIRDGIVERTVKIAHIDGKTVSLCPKSSNPKFQPIVVKVNKGLHEPDGTEVRLVGLVIARYSPL
jgi:hypothetical protein